jgi:hypothetical protein
MPIKLEAPAQPGPLKTVDAFGGQMPFYVITFDKHGACTSPKSADHLIGQLAAGAATDVLLYSHGWNNDFPTSQLLYDRFVTGLSEMAAAHGGAGAAFRPVFVGIAWPSTALTFGDESGPTIAAAGVAAVEQDELLDALPQQTRSEVSELLAVGKLAPDKAKRLAELLAPHVGSGDNREGVEGAVEAADLLTAWQSQADSDDDDAADGFTNFGTAGAQPAADAQAAGLLTYLDPRWIVRLATVLLMKDRAGTVGANGVADLVGRILGESNARLFLVGHSYGCKVVMTSLAVRQPQRKAEAALLLQPAVSRLCFAADIGDGRQGGFRPVLDRVRQPVFLTHSTRDVPLHSIFHLAVRRAKDLGEAHIAAVPSRYAALGGYGPSVGGYLAGECNEVALPDSGVWPNGLARPTKIVSFDGSAIISGHGDISRAEVYWAMLNLLK